MDNKQKTDEEKKIEDYEPGTTQAQVHQALKKVAKAKPSPKQT